MNTTNFDFSLMDQKIDAIEENRCYRAGFESDKYDVNPYDYDGDGYRAAAWDLGRAA